MRLPLLLLLLSLAACSQQNVDTLFPPKHAVRIRIYPERAVNEFQLNVQDTRGGAAGSYVANERMDAMARAHCQRQSRDMQVVSRGKFYMGNNLSTTLWFRCASNAAEGDAAAESAPQQD